MKTISKLITGVIIVSVIYIYIKNTKTTQKHNTKDICTQTESDMHMELDEIASDIEDKLNVIEESNSDIETEDEYIHNEESHIEEVENLSNQMSQDNGLRNMNVVELKELAKEQQVKGYSRMKKSEYFLNEYIINSSIRITKWKEM